MIHPRWKNQVAALKNQFLAATPFPHLVLTDFFETEFCQALVRAFPHEENIEESEKRTIATLATAGEPYTKLHELFSSRRFINFIEGITGKEGLVFDNSYFGGGIHENANKQMLDYHIDFNFHPERGWYRCLNILLFLNEKWEEDWGGCLELVEKPWQQQPGVDKIVLPLKNTLVIFETSECSWHGFKKIELPEGLTHETRKSVALYFYQKSPPREVAKHSTVYVNEPLPEEWKNSQSKLSAAEWNKLQELLQRRDDHISQLYQKVRELESVNHSQQERIKQLDHRLCALEIVRHQLIKEICELNGKELKL